MTIESRLAEIRARAENATEGPWEAGPREGGLAEVNTAPAHAAWLTDTTRPVIYEVVNQALRADAEFIAASRTDLPALLAAVEAVMGLADRLEWEADPASHLGPDLDYCRIATAQRIRTALTAALDPNTTTREEQS